MTTPGAIRAHRTVVVVEDAPTTPEEGVDPAGAHTVVWYVSGRGVCRPAVFHYDDRAATWVRGAPCDSVVDGGIVVQPTWGGRVELRLVHLKFDGREDESPWSVNYRMIAG